MTAIAEVAPDVLAKYELVIGIECHVELKTASKMFCACPNEFGGEPNTKVCPVCLAMPGALPVPNKAAIQHMIRAGLAFDAEIPHFSKFDRKNYFYPDMPKNYQITQFDMPITQGGVVEFWLDDGTRGSCRLTRIHLEEDTGKSSHAGSGDGRIAGSSYSLIDFNRAGVPLMECVGEPDLRSADEAVAFLESLKRTFVQLGVSDVKMEEGSLRCDANVSVRLKGATEYGTKAEIKNMNSFRSVHRAIASEFVRQVGVIESGGRVVQETRGWDETTGTSVSMRSKEQAHDYRYFPEPDLVPIELEPAHIAALKAALPPSPAVRHRRYVESYGFTVAQATQLVDNVRLAEYFDRAVSLTNAPQAVMNFVLGDLSRLANETETHVADAKITPEALAELIAMLAAKTINSKIAKDVIVKLWNEGGSAKAVVEKEGLAQVSDPGAVAGFVDDVLAANVKSVEDFRAGKENALKFLVGAVMKVSRGKANPALVEQALRDRM